MNGRSGAAPRARSRRRGAAKPAASGHRAAGSAPRRTARGAAVLAAATAALLAGCAAAPSAPAERDGTARGSITIAVAASLSGPFETLADRFERDRPGVDVQPVVVDGSSALATQIAAGAPYDVFASADAATMAGIAAHVDEPVGIATSTLVIVVPEGNPSGIGSLEDLADVDTVLCAPEVPCGAASARLLARAGVEVRAVSLEQSVRGVLTKVEANAVDAGLVYATDARWSDAVDTIVPAGAEAVVNRAMLAAVSASAEPELAAAFVDYAAGPAGLEALAELGFGAP